MNASTKSILQRRIADLSHQVTDQTNEIRRAIDRAKHLIAELEDATAALRGLMDEERPSDSSDQLLTSILNNSLISESSAVGEDVESTSGMVNRIRPKRASVRPGTIKAEVLSILRRHPSGLIAIDILRLLNETRTMPIQRTSLSPQLSRLAQAGHVRRRGSLWFIPTESTIKTTP